MSKLDYTAFDAELMALIKAGRNRMALLETDKPLLRMAEPLRTKGTYGVTPAWRVIDRRLQALRKKGKIRHNGKVWEIVQA